MPKLTCFIRFFLVELVFELGISLAQLLVKLGLVLDIVEIEALPWCENDNLLREIAIRRVV
jgi:hypothetical protein